MKKQMSKISMAMVAAVMLATPVWATDYSGMSTDELSKIRGTLQNASEQERENFRKEWQNRVGDMTPEERQQYMGPGNKKSQGKGQGQGQGKGMGKGQGSGRS